MTSPSNPGPGAPQPGSPAGASAGSPPGAATAGFCAACGAALSAGARFCHRCGTPVGQGLPVVRSGNAGGVGAVLPWGVAFVALLALVAAFAGRNFGSAKGSGIDGSSNSLPTSAIDGVGAQGPASGPPGGGPAPDIASLSPSERASRLYIRIMTYAERGNVDSVAFFAPMALASHEMLTAPTPDERYHYGRVAELTGNGALARAQADTILAERPTSLLGLMLASTSARMTGDSTAGRRFDAALLQHLDAELATKQPEYELHRPEIDRAAAAARRPR